MSGGTFGNTGIHMEDAIAIIQEVIDDNDRLDFDKWGDRIGKGYSPKTIARLREAIALLKASSTILERVDLLLSGDSSEESFNNKYPKPYGIDG